MPRLWGKTSKLIEPISSGVIVGGSLLRAGEMVSLYSRGDFFWVDCPEPSHMFVVGGKKKSIKSK